MEQINEYKKKYFDALMSYAGLFEAIFDGENLENFYNEYGEVIHQINLLTGKQPRNTYIEEIEQQEGELPFEIFPGTNQELSKITFLSSDENNFKHFKFD